MLVSECYVEADPYDCPFDGSLTIANTALIIIDMQTDFSGPQVMWIPWVTICH